jgi:hypothetical protein
VTEAAVLQAILRREGRSLLHYVSEAFPWITPEEQQALAKLQEIIQEESAALGRLSGYLLKQRIRLPYLGAYSMSFTNINYVSLEHLVPLLATYQQDAIAQLEQDLHRVQEPTARQLVQQLIAMKRRHLATLQEIASAKGQAVSKA